MNVLFLKPYRGSALITQWFLFYCMFIFKLNNFSPPSQAETCSKILGLYGSLVVEKEEERYRGKNVEDCNS